MSTYRLSLTTVKRSEGRNAAAVIAYRTGFPCYSRRLGRTFHYRKREHAVPYMTFVNWDGTAEAFADAIEQSERRRDSVLGREIVLSLPYELPPAARHAATQAYAEWLYARFGVAVLACAHAPSIDGDQRNYHSHLFLTGRVVSADGVFGVKTSELDNRRTGSKAIEEMRAKWAAVLNVSLTDANRSERLDHRSYVRQGVNRESESQTRPALVLARRGVRTARSERRRRAVSRNLLRDVEARTLRGGVLRTTDSSEGVASDERRTAKQAAGAQAVVPHPESSNHRTATPTHPPRPTGFPVKPSARSRRR